MGAPALIDLKKISMAPFLLDEDAEDFLTFTMSVLPKYYDDVDESLGASIIRTHELGYDPVGHFTKRKVIRRVLYEGVRIGYVVVTEKRGGSIKIGPTILYEGWRGLGIGTQLRKMLSHYYSRLEVRKAYSTVADNKLESYRYLVKSGYQVEAHLFSHYSAGHGELVFGQMLQPPTYLMAQEPPFGHSIRCEVRANTEGLRDMVAEYLLARMADSFTEIDRSFVHNLFLAEDRGQERFAEKGKTVFVAHSEGRVVGVCLTTAKRGGAVKVAPLLGDAGNVVAELADAVRAHYGPRGSRKIYIIIPEHHRRAVRVLHELGYSGEGILREPYHRGIDMRVMSTFMPRPQGNHPVRPDVLLSILPDPVERILAGRKEFEIRKNWPSTTMRGMFLFATGGISTVPCYVELAGYFRSEKERLWNIIGERGAPKSRFDAYLRGYTAGTAIAISRICHFEQPVTMGELRAVDPGFHVPRQFIYLDENAPVHSVLSEARARGRWTETHVHEIIDRFRDEFIPYEFG